MSDRNFFDTNIFVYSVDSGAPQSKATSATALIRAGIANRNAVSRRLPGDQEFVNVALRKFEVPDSFRPISADISMPRFGAWPWCIRRWNFVHATRSVKVPAFMVRFDYRRSRGGVGCRRSTARICSTARKFGAVQILTFPLTLRAAGGHRMYDRHMGRWVPPVVLSPEF